MTSTREDWGNTVFAGHLTWHLTLYYFGRHRNCNSYKYIVFDRCTDLGDMESLFREFDDVLFKKALSDNRLGLLDSSSLLWRLNTMGIDVGEERWKRVTDALATHVNNHRSPWLVYCDQCIN